MSVPQVALLALAVCCALASAHFNDPRLSTFLIRSVDSKQQTVELALEDDSSKCTFSYVTNPAEAGDKPVVPTEKVVDMQAMVAKLSGTCVQRRTNYWNYELCFGGMFKQYHDSEVFALGRVGAVEDTKLVFADGELCQAKDPAVPRTAEVEFYCNPNVPGAVLDEVNERQVCEYHVSVATSLVCGDSRFLTVSPRSEQANADSQMETEDWFLEIAHLDDGRVMCSTYSTELRSAGSRLHFREFELKLTAGASIVSSADPVANFIARHPGRLTCAADAVVMTRTSIRQSPSFNGKLAYLKVTS